MSTTVTREWVRDAVDRWERKLVAYAARILHDEEAARDVVQEVYLRLCEHRGPRPALPAWLYTVCRHRALDVRRKESRMTTTDDGAALAASRETAPPDAAATHEGAASALDAFGTLSDDQQEVLRLKLHDGLSYRQISDVTGHSLSNVGVLIHTALKLLRTRLGGDGLSAAGRRPA